MFYELKSKYENFFGSEPSNGDAIKEIEKALGVQMPDDFKYISTFYSGGDLGGVSHYEIASSGEATNIVEETLRLRKAIGLADKFVVIAEPVSGLIVIDTVNNNVIWCDSVDAINLNEGSCVNPDVWESYSDFFQYLLDEVD